MSHLLGSLQVETIDGDFSHCDSSWQYRDVNSPFARFYCVTRGEGLVVQGSARHRLVPGALTVIPAHTRSDFHCSGFMELYWVHFTALLVGDIDFFDLLECPHQLRPANMDRIYNMFRRLLELRPSAEPADILEIDAIVRRLLALFAAETDPSWAGEKTKRVARFGQVLDYINRNSHRRMTTPELARVANLHPTYFANLFTQQLGVSPQRFVQNRRIQRAKQLLLDSEDKLETIAEQLGFADAFHLSKVFKKTTGVSPSRFRCQDRPAL